MNFLNNLKNNILAIFVDQNKKNKLNKIRYFNLFDF